MNYVLGLSYLFGTPVLLFQAEDKDTAEVLKLTEEQYKKLEQAGIQSAEVRQA